MTIFEQTLHLFAKKLKCSLPGGELNGKIELSIDGNPVMLCPGHHPDTFVAEVPLAIMLRPIPEDRLLELCRMHYLGASTSGCTLALDDEGVALLLKGVTTPGTSAQENCDWLHRLIASARHLVTVIEGWETAVPLFQKKEASS